MGPAAHFAHSRAHRSWACLLSSHGLARVAPNNSFKPTPVRGLRSKVWLLWHPRLTAGSFRGGLTQALGPVIISFEGPTFFVQADEDQFFGWLRSLPECQDIRGIGTTLDLVLAAPVSSDTVQQLVVVFRRWNIEVTPLLPLRSLETDDFVLWNMALREESSGA